LTEFVLITSMSHQKVFQTWGQLDLSKFFFWTFNSRF